MIQHFGSSELNELVQEQFATGTFATEEDVLLAALRSYRDLATRRRAIRSELDRRSESVRQGEGTVLDGDAALGEFLDAIDREVDSERATQGGAA